RAEGVVDALTGAEARRMHGARAAEIVGLVGVDLEDRAGRHEDMAHLVHRHGDEAAHGRMLLLHLAQHRLAQHRQPREGGTRGYRGGIYILQPLAEERRVVLGMGDLLPQGLHQSLLALGGRAGLQAVVVLGHRRFLESFGGNRRRRRPPLPSHPDTLYQSSNILRSLAMSNVRIDYDTFRKTVPAAQAALLSMGKAVDECELDKALVELGKLRVAQVNNCAFCLQIHLNVARRLGLPPGKPDPAGTWDEAGLLPDP